MNRNTEHLKQTRLEICRICPYVKHNRAVGLTCGTLMRKEYDRFGNELTCGCILGLKAGMPSKHCPQKKW